MGVNFLHMNVWDTVVILEQVNLTHPKCPRCDMLVPWKALNSGHITTTQCTKGEEWKISQLEEE